MKKILVTGASGFIGLNFISAYKKKYDIVSPAEEETDLVKHEDVCRLFAQNKFDAVLHIAGQRYFTDCDALDADSLIAYKNIQYAALLYGVKKIVVVSDASDLNSAVPHVNAAEDEFGKNMPVSGYGLGRYLVHQVAGKDGISTVLRFFDVLGAGAAVKEGTPLEILSHAVVGKKQIEIPADRTFSTVYIEDACKIISLFLDNDYEKGIYNVASGAVVTLSDFAKKAKSYAKKDGRDITVSVGNKVLPELTADTAKLLGTIGSFKFTAFNTAVTKTLDYCKSHKSLLRPKAENK